MVTISDINSTNIIYIMGTGRSGTTILEILLCGNSEVYGTGELTHIFRDGFLGNRVCACGERFGHCVFWGQVRQRLGGSPKEFLQFFRLFNSVDWHKGFFKLFLGAFSSRKLAAYNEISRKLIDACMASSGKNTIVDSSKYPARALMLNRLYGKNLRIICLTRSPEGIFRAFRKENVQQPSKKPFAIFFYYAYVLCCCRLVGMATGNVLFISFEDLVSKPVETLNRIEDFTGLDIEESRARIRDGKAFSPGHIITGNRLRQKKEIYFRQKQSPAGNGDGGSNFFCLMMKAVAKILGF